ncbi:hypothetical protein CI109_107091 [Kwoniella shandongensis]|uniref:Uncharacterized protein n=1 Tax=Kwoniella shandongensis TaxID=1734106 RepID=A0A5M6C220_9TREE|nr:uncharacterized protein CI109_002374 [Kwoniella shandongensis]KAA5529033.1 hypothetical protein CI109_002374 [Kwoniella shandongensis]
MTSIDENTNFHTFDHPVRSVAIIGSGPSGSPAIRQLRDAGLRVRVFERQDKPGGIWNWKPAVSLPLSVPTPPPSEGAFVPTIRDSSIVDDPKREIRDKFNPPNPCYWNLTNNVPTTTMAFKDFPYPPGTALNISHELIASYVRNYVENFGLDKLTSYNTRVEKAVKEGNTWILTLRKVIDDGDDKAREEYWTEEFDALVVATGHYNAAYIPDLEGAEQWSAAWPNKVIHSQGYRVPEPYAGKTVLIVGLGTSGNDIARDLSPHVNKLYLVGKNVLRGPVAYQQQRRMQRYLVPDNSEKVAEIKRFVPLKPGQALSEGTIELTDGRTLTGVDEIIFATGYQYSFPFLPQFHKDPGSSKPATFSPLVTEVFSTFTETVNTSAFSFFEYQSISIARVFSGNARIPDEAGRWKAYAKLVREKGEGKFSHLLNRDGEKTYVEDTVAWINSEAAVFGAPPIEGHSEEWLAESAKIKLLIAERYGLDPAELANLPDFKATPEEEQYKSAQEETNKKAAEGIARRVAASAA